MLTRPPEQVGDQTWAKYPCAVDPPVIALGQPAGELLVIRRHGNDPGLVVIPILGEPAALGGSAITAVASLEAGRRTARHTDTAELAARRLEAYANLLVAAGDVLGTYRRNLAALSPDFGQKDADKANAHMADLAAALHRASAVVALTGSDVGRRQGKDLYETAKGVAANRIVPTGDPNYAFYMGMSAGDKELETAIDDYKAALVPETTAIPRAPTPFEHIFRRRTG